MDFRQMIVGHERLVRELNEERTAALVRISRVLESLIAQLHAARVRIESGDAADQAREIARYHELRRLAVQYRWFLEVQREALGLRQHHRLDEFYPIPAPLQAGHPADS
jgi:hypothetical protein